MRAIAEEYLKKALNDPEATFRDGQWESIERLLKNERILVVQRTGWGKSMVYFVTTKLLRQQGRGPTIIISPLLSLIRNQLNAALGLGIVGRTINSSNNQEWDQISNEIIEDKVDVLLISPERLGNNDFRQDILSRIVKNIGLFVVDEAHCISDWGHDFRPDYRRISRVLQVLPSNLPVLATTATANNRVVDDIKIQIGHGISVVRGTLVRKSLKLQNIDMPSPAARMAWLAKTIPLLSGSGIVYTLTQRDAERVANWLQSNGIDAKAYHANIDESTEDGGHREELEQQLLANKVKVIVATVALGMGFDKPDLGFVIHFQRPSSVVHYYQQVGRAGRAVDEAFGILLCGEEDDSIAEYFISNAFPPQKHVSAVLEALSKSESGLSAAELQRLLNLRKGQIEKTIKFLTIESPSPLTKIKSNYFATTTALTYSINQEYVNAISALRRAEQQQMRDYMQHTGCLMTFLQNALDDPNPSDCGKCINCAPSLLLDTNFDEDLANKAVLFLKRSHFIIKPRKQWPVSNIFKITNLNGYKIGDELQAKEGRALSLWRDAGWGQLVADGKYRTGFFDHELINACIEMLQNWMPNPSPSWITCIPSLNRPKLVSDFAQRLAIALNLPFIPCIEKIATNSPQKEMENSYQQVRNLDGVFVVNELCLQSPCLLIDDVVDSGWTFTVASALLRRAGASAVLPLALALNTPKMD